MVLDGDHRGGSYGNSGERDLLLDQTQNHPSTDISLLKKMRDRRRVSEALSEVSDATVDTYHTEDTNDTTTGQQYSSYHHSHHSPSLDSLSSGGSFPDRRKKKPKFQVMLEKAREEEQKQKQNRQIQRALASERGEEKLEKKPLYQRMVEKAQVDSEVQEKQKIEAYKRQAAQKRQGAKIPPIAARSSSDYASPNLPRVGRDNWRDHPHDFPSSSVGQLHKLPPRSSQDMIDSRENSYADADHHHRSEHHGGGVSEQRRILRDGPGSRREGQGGKRESVGGNSMPKEKRKIIISNKKSVPLYQRLAMQAKIEAERESKEKLEKYNVIRLQKQAAKAPTREELRERERQLELDQDRLALARDKGGGGMDILRKKQHQHPPGIERNHIEEGNLRDITPPPGPYGPGGGGGGAVRGHHLGNPRSRIKMNPLGNYPPSLRKIEDRSPYRSNSHHAVLEGRDLDKRPVAYNEHATPLNPSGDDDSRVGGMFSPLSMDSIDANHHHHRNSNNSSHRNDPSSNSLSKQNEVGVKPLRGRGRGPRFAGMSIDDDDHHDGNSFEAADDQGGGVNSAAAAVTNKLTHARNGSPRIKKRADNYDLGSSVETMPTEGYSDTANTSKVSFKLGGGSNRRTQHTQSSAASVNSSNSVNSMLSSMVSGPQWLADVLESDQGESGMVMMYAEGFAMYMQEQGLIQE